MNPLLTAALLVVGLGLFGYSAVTRLRPLLALRREDRRDRAGERLAGLLRFGFGQKRLVDPEERTAGVLHVVLFAAFLVLALRTITLFGVGFSPGFHLPLLGPGTALGQAYDTLKTVVVWAALVAALGFLWRRLVTKPARVTASWEGTLVVGFIIALMVSEILYEHAGWLGLPPGPTEAVSQGSFWLHLVVILLFLNFLPIGKHFHVITALPNVFFRRLPPEARLAKLDLESEGARFGTATAKDLSWKEGWDVYSCTECGRCQTHCPTHVTGKPLSHKEVNRSIRKHLGQVGPTLIDWGVPASEALRLFAERVNTPLVKRMVSIIIKANDAGGSVADVLTMVAHDARETIINFNERRISMATYTVVIYVAFGVFLATIFILNSTFLPNMEEAGQQVNDSAIEAGVTNLPATIQSEIIPTVQLIFIVSVAIHAFGDGILAGVLQDGKVANGLRHSFIMLLIGFLGTILITG